MIKISQRIQLFQAELIGLTTNENSSTGFLNFGRNVDYDCDNNEFLVSLSNRPECKAPDTKAVSNQRKRKKKEEELRDSKCFYKNAQNKADCISVDVRYSGVWGYTL